MDLFSQTHKQWCAVGIVKMSQNTKTASNRRRQVIYIAHLFSNE